jgi:cellulose biosynthesis protein BcsQ
MKSLKVLVVSSKGGVGKSTVSMQIIAPYLYQKNNNNKISFYEFDDENIDSLSYGGSQLSHREPIEVEEFVLMDKLIEILSRDEFCCIDVGGNKSTTLCIDAINGSGMVNMIDLAVIPLLDGEQDAINAKKVYDLLKELNPDINILFALNKVKNPKYIKYQFDSFFGDIRGIFDDSDAIVKHIEDNEKENYIIIEDNDIIKYSRKFGTTIFEIAEQKRDFMLELEKADQEKEKKLIGFKNYVYQNGKKYYENILRPCFTKIDQILKG